MTEQGSSEYQKTDPQLQHLLETGLKQVKRWQNSGYELDQEETDYDHVIALQEMFTQDIQTLCPTLFQRVDKRVVADMIWIHDAGEIVATDLARSHPQYQDLKETQKQKERRALYHLTRRFIPDAVRREKVRSIYDKYEKKEGIEALLVTMLDKAQALRFGVAHAYPRSRMPDTADYQGAVENILRKPASMLYEQLSEDEQQELGQFILHELSFHAEQGGYQQAAAVYRKQVQENTFFLSGKTPVDTSIAA